MPGLVLGTQIREMTCFGLFVAMSFIGCKNLTIAVLPPIGEVLSSNSDGERSESCSFLTMFPSLLLSLERCLFPIDPPNSGFCGFSLCQWFVSNVNKIQVQQTRQYGVCVCVTRRDEQSETTSAGPDLQSAQKWAAYCVA